MRLLFDNLILVFIKGLAQNGQYNFPPIFDVREVVIDKVTEPSYDVLFDP